MSEERYGATEAGTVVLEIGALTGALVLRPRRPGRPRNRDQPGSRACPAEAHLRP
jgi:hypothetical protein